ncbi:MAG TPA: hypothetical protein GYA07_09765 [Verrucomicrobia bacterium]|nr:hypothetical protein [Verrucomicrobiota bacterium]HOP97953.1 polysaccharide biosynthesis/export family protein [Verrucomicrobiota bacterium]
MRHLLAGAVGLAVFCGCRTQSPYFSDFDRPPAMGQEPQMVTLTNRMDPVLLEPPTNLFTLGPGDRLDIELVDEPTSRVTTVVGPDGRIYFNLLPGVDVWGLTLGEAKTALETNLQQYIRGTPRVNLTLREVASKRVWLLGRFQEPGVYNLAAPTTLLEAVAMAGGALTFSGMRDVTGGPLAEELADLDRSFIIRNGKLLPVDFDRLLNKGDLTQNIYLQPDDFVYFAPAHAREIYVLGAVVQPRPVPYTEGMTVAAAVAGAYGTVRDAYLYHVVVVRGALTQPEVTIINLKDVTHGKVADIALKPNDIVYVPFSPYRYLRRYAEIALNTFVSSVAINAGTSLAARRQAGPGGVVIPVGSGIQIIPPPAPPIR